MAASGITTVVNVLQEVFAQKETTRQFDEGSLLLDIIEYGDQNAPQFVEMSGAHDGKYVIFPLHTAGNPNAGVGVRESRQYPVEGGQTYAQAKYRCRYIVSVLGLTTQVMSRAGGDPQAIFDVAAREASSLIANTRRRMNLWMHRDGSGKLADAVSYSNTNAAAGTPLTVDSTADIPVGAEIIVREKATGGWQTGTLPTGWYTTDVSTGEPAVVGAKDSTTLWLLKRNGTTNFGTGGDGTTNTMGVYLWDSQGTYPYGIDNVCETINPAAQGFNHLTTVTATDDGSLNASFGAIDRTVTANAYWKALNNTDDGITTNLGGLAVSIEDHIQPLVSAIITEDSTLDGEDAIIAVSRQSQWWQIVNQLESGKRTEVRTKIVDGKYDAVRYNMITFCYDQQSTSQTMKFFAPRYLFRMQATPWQFEELGGSQYTQVLGSIQRPTSAWRKNLFSEQQLCASYCGVNCKFTNIAA